MKQEKRNFIKKNAPMLVILFLLGIIFLCLSEYDSSKSTGNGSADFDSENYAENLEEQLCSILEKMDGVEDVQVMITLESGARYQISDETGNAYRFDTYVSSFSLQNNSEKGNGSRVIEITAPKIKGVSVVCKGAENISVKERIINLISSTLNLTKNKIYVTK